MFAAPGQQTLRSASGLVALVQWLLQHRGPLASNIAEAFAFTGIFERAAPDCELLFAPVEWRNQGLEEPKIDAITIAPVVLQPRSRGTVRLKTPNARDAPAIDFQLLTDPGGRDAEILVAGARLARRVATTGPLAERLSLELPTTAGAQSDEDMLQALKMTAQTVYHPTSTCRMGADERAPVDGALRVRGIDQLWVADASVMPSVPRGHTNAPTAMIAARAVQWVQ
jgi:choline dehydrogenase